MPVRELLRVLALVLVHAGPAVGVGGGRGGAGAGERPSAGVHPEEQAARVDVVGHRLDALLDRQQRAVRVSLSQQGLLTLSVSLTERESQQGLGAGAGAGAASGAGQGQAG